MTRRFTTWAFALALIALPTSIVYVTSPAAARVRLLMEIRPNGHAQVRAAHPGDAKPEELAFERWNEPLLETDFWIEDLMESHFNWRNQTLLREEKYGARQLMGVCHR